MIKSSGIDKERLLMVLSVYEEKAREIIEECRKEGML
jgi:DNA invertase Pin-like site-specific DNA recombinase